MTANARPRPVSGAFDVVVEILPSLAIIRYRMVPQHHHHLHLLFVTTAIWTFAGTVLQSIVAMYLFGSLWDKWELSFKTATPILHVAFSAAQLHGRISSGKWRDESENGFSKIWTLRHMIPSKMNSVTTVAKEVSPMPPRVRVGFHRLYLILYLVL